MARLMGRKTCNDHQRDKTLGRMYRQLWGNWESYSPQSLQGMGRELVKEGFPKMRMLKGSPLG